MASPNIIVKIDGLQELRDALRDFPRKLRKKLLAKPLRQAANIIRDEARAGAPVLQTAARHRRPGTIRRNIIVRTSKFSSRAGNVGLYVSVRPLSGSRQKKLGRAGATNPNDPYYWWWQEFGWVAGGGRIRGGVRRRALEKSRRLQSGQARKIPGKFFMTGAYRSKGQTALETLGREAVLAVQQLNVKGASA